MSDQLELRLLGGLSINKAGAPITGLASRKAEALLAYLACTRREHQRELLADLLWDNRTQERALGNLRVLLTSLRQIVGEHLEIRRHTVAFSSASNAWIDVALLEAQVAAARGAALDEQLAGQLGQALTLYTGDFLAGIHLRDSSAFEAWAADERERLCQLALEGLDRLAEHALRTSSYEAGLSYAARALELDPLREQAHRQLMLLYARSGNPAAALAQYERCAAILDQELGIEPEEETRALISRLRSGDTRAHNLPAAATPFIGRAAELALLAERLADQASRIITLVGPGGVGKTRLALQAASQQLGRTLHGVYFVTLEGLNDPAGIITAIAEVLDFQLAGPRLPQVQLANFLRQRELLLVLDTFEQVLAGAPQLADLVAAAPDVTLLITSRERLGLHGEWTIELGGLPYPAVPDAADSADSEAVQLFLEGCRRIRGNFSPSDEDWPAIVRICQMVGGLPLGIELAATWTRALSCVEIVAELERGLDFLATALPDVPERHRSLRAVFRHAWALLNAQERTVYLALAVFRGGFQRAAAAEVAGATPLLLAGLVDRAFIQLQPSGRYSTHEHLRQFAEEQLGHERAAVRAQHAAYFAQLLEQHGRQLQGAGQQAAIHALAAEIANIRAAWSTLVEQRAVEQLERSIEPLYDFYHLRGWYREGLDLLEHAAAMLEGQRALGHSPDRSQGQALIYCGFLSFRLALYGQAQELMQAGLPMARAAEDWSAESAALTGLAHVAYIGGRHGEAEQLFEAALRRAEAHGDHWRSFGPLSGLGVLANARGEYHRARQIQQAALTLSRELGIESTTAATLTNLGVVLRSLGAYAEAQDCYAESIAIRRAIGDRRGLALALNNLANVMIALERYVEAQQLHQQALEQQRELGDPWGISLSLHNLGDVALRLGQLAHARQLYRESLAIRRTIDDRRGIAFTLAALGQTALKLGDLAEADATLCEALRIIQEQRATPLLLSTLVRYADLCILRQDRALAAAILGMVASHPAADHTTQLAAEQLLADIEQPDAAPQSAWSAEQAVAAVLQLQQAPAVRQR